MDNLETLRASIQEISKDIDSEAIKERLEQYIELMKVKDLLLEEILKLSKSQEKNQSYAEKLLTDLDAYEKRSAEDERGKLSRISELLGDK